MKKLIFILLVVLTTTGCENGDQIAGTYPLVAYGDNSVFSGHSSGTFVFGFGSISGDAGTELKYQVMVKDTDGTIYPITIDQHRTTFKIIDTTQQPSIDIKYSKVYKEKVPLKAVQNPNTPYIFSYTIYIPEHAIRYDNYVDGK